MCRQPPKMPSLHINMKQCKYLTQDQWTAESPKQRVQQQDHYRAFSRAHLFSRVLTHKCLQEEEIAGGGKISLILLLIHPCQILGKPSLPGHGLYGDGHCHRATIPTATPFRGRGFRWLFSSLFFHLRSYFYTLPQGRHETPPCSYCLVLALHTCTGCFSLDFCLIVTAITSGLSQLLCQICQDPVKMWQPSLFQFVLWTSRKATSGNCSLPTASRKEHFLFALWDGRF